MDNDYLKIAGNIHLSYYVEAAEILGIPYEIPIYAMTARFETNGQPWFINTTALPINSAPSSRLARAKQLTNKILANAGIPVPKQIVAQTAVEAISFFREYKNIVLKPSQNLGGHGVSILPQTEKDVENAFIEAANNDKHNKVLVEEFIQGINYRVLVLGDKVIAAVRRLPAHVIGDGFSTIDQLIDNENLERKNKGLLPIPNDEETDRHIKEQGLQHESIIESGKVIYLRKNTNLTTGGTTEECLGYMNEYYKNIAIEATKALGLEFGGVDLIATDVTQPNQSCAINEINYNPGLRLHYKVDKGERVKVAIPIMEYIRDRYQKLYPPLSI